jgi:transporter family-2 protein
MTYLYVLAFISGTAMALQAGFNAQLGNLLGNAQLAAVVAFFCSLFFAVITLMFINQTLPSLVTTKAVPIYLWFSGGLLSAVGISLVYFFIPKIGMGTMMPYFLIGQLVMAVIAGHLGWFNMPIKPITLHKIIGLLALVIGIILINKEA